MLAVAALVRGRGRPGLAPRFGAAAIAFGIAGKMIGSGALVGVLLFT